MISSPALTLRLPHNTSIVKEDLIITDSPNGKDGRYGMASSNSLLARIMSNDSAKPLSPDNREDVSMHQTIIKHRKHLLENKLRSPLTQYDGDSPEAHLLLHRRDRSNENKQENSNQNDVYDAASLGLQGTKKSTESRYRRYSDALSDSDHLNATIAKKYKKPHLKHKRKSERSSPASIPLTKIKLDSDMSNALIPSQETGKVKAVYRHGVVDKSEKRVKYKNVKLKVDPPPPMPPIRSLATVSELDYVHIEVLDKSDASKAISVLTHDPFNRKLDIRPQITISPLAFQGYLTRNMISPKDQADKPSMFDFPMPFQEPCKCSGVCRCPVNYQQDVSSRASSRPQTASTRDSSSRNSSPKRLTVTSARSSASYSANAASNPRSIVVNDNMNVISRSSVENVGDMEPIESQKPILTSRRKSFVEPVKMPVIRLAKTENKKINKIKSPLRKSNNSITLQRPSSWKDNETLAGSEQVAIDSCKSSKRIREESKTSDSIINDDDEVQEVTNGIESSKSIDETSKDENVVTISSHNLSKIFDSSTNVQSEQEKQSKTDPRKSEMVIETTLVCASPGFNQNSRSSHDASPFGNEIFSPSLAGSSISQESLLSGHKIDLRYEEANIVIAERGEKESHEGFNDNVSMASPASRITLHLPSPSSKGRMVQSNTSHPSPESRRSVASVQSMEMNDNVSLGSTYLVGQHLSALPRDGHVSILSSSRPRSPMKNDIYSNKGRASPNRTILGSGDAVRRTDRRSPSTGPWGRSKPKPWDRLTIDSPLFPEEVMQPTPLKDVLLSNGKSNGSNYFDAIPGIDRKTRDVLANRQTFPVRNLPRKGKMLSKSLDSHISKLPTKRELSRSEEYFLLGHGLVDTHVAKTVVKQQDLAKKTFEDYAVSCKDLK